MPAIRSQIDFICSFFHYHPISVNQQSTAATLVNTPLDLYQHLSAFPSDTKWKMTCRDCNQSSFKVENGIIHLKLVKTSPLYSLLNTRRRSSTKALLSALEHQQMPEIIKWKQQQAWEQVGRSNVLQLYELLDKIDEMSTVCSAHLVMKFFVRNKAITALTVNLNIPSLPPSITVDALTNNKVLLFFQQLSSRYFPDKTANQNRYRSGCASHWQRKLEKVFGSRRLLMLHALKEVIDN